MVLITRGDAINRQIINKYKIFKAFILGISCIIVPVLIIIIDPVHLIVNYNLELRIGSRLYNILVNDIKAARLSVYLFNITNAERFQSGEDPKLKMEEVGPFVFQEYRWFEDLETSDDGSTMAMTPKFRSEFVPEASLAHPKDVTLTLPNLSMLASVVLLSNYPGMVKSLYNSVAGPMKAIIQMDVHNYLWGYEDPLITLFNKLTPGLVYFDKIGLLERLYDNQSDYRVVVGATGKDRFKIKSVTKNRHLQSGSFHDDDVSELIFKNTYEGVGYPPELSPGVPISLYRVGICKTFDLEYVKSKTMDYGGEGLVYTLRSSPYGEEHNPVTKEPYPYGLMDISKCFYGVPYVISKAHFLDADPVLLKDVDGLEPLENSDDYSIVIDRRVAITFNTSMPLQLSLMMNDVSFNRETSRFSNITLPIVRANVDQPRMSDGTMLLFYLVYTIIPWTLLAIEIVLFIIGLALIAYAVRSMYFNWSSSNRMIFESAIEKRILSETPSGVPLISDRRKASGVILE